MVFFCTWGWKMRLGSHLPVFRDHSWLCLGIIPYAASGGTVCSAGNWTRVDHIQDKYLNYTFSSASTLFSFRLLRVILKYLALGSVFGGLRSAGDWTEVHPMQGNCLNPCSSVSPACCFVFLSPTPSHVMLECVIFIVPAVPWNVNVYECVCWAPHVWI